MDTRPKDRVVADAVRSAVYSALGKSDPFRVVLGVSNHHVHLCEEDFITLFGAGAELSVRTKLRQTGEFAANETVKVIGPKGSFDRVRLMGPHRAQTQVELSFTDAFQLGVNAPVCESGELDDAAPITIEGPNGTITKEHAAMVAGRHLHISPAEAAALGVKDSDRVSAEFMGRRGGVLDNLKVRVKDHYQSEVHIDMDEANALGAKSGDYLRIIIP